jgi:hypothetical protein
MHSVDERYLGSQSSERDSRSSMDEQRCDPQDEMVIDDDLESGMEKSVQ